MFAAVALTYRAAGRARRAADVVAAVALQPLVVVAIVCLAVTAYRRRGPRCRPLLGGVPPSLATCAAPCLGGPDNACLSGPSRP